MSGSVTSAFCTTCKVEIFKGQHNFTLTTGNTFKAALFKATASLVGTYGAATTNYSDMTGNGDETTGTGYTVGGATLVNITPVLSGTVAVVSFGTITWTAVTLSASGILVYNTSNSNSAVCVISFGQDWSPSSANLIYSFPTADATNAIIRAG